MNDKNTAIIFDIKRYAIHDGPGIRTTVFLKGCPLKCLWCHNPESWSEQPQLALRTARCIRCGRCLQACKNNAISLIEKSYITNPQNCTACGTCVDACPSAAREMIGKPFNINDLMKEIEKDVIFFDQSGGGVTFSGGEPLMHPEFLLEILKLCRHKEIHTCIDSACYAPQDILEKVAASADMFLCDLKHMQTFMHQRFTGVGNEIILQNISCLSTLNKTIIIRVPIIPGFNDDHKNIEAIGRYVVSLKGVMRIDILPYNPGGLEKSDRLIYEYDLMESKTPSPAQMEEIAQILRNQGLNVKIGG